MKEWLVVNDKRDTWVELAREGREVVKCSK
jgi:hypothetical protein